MRDLIKMITRKEVAKLRPDYSYATVSTIDRETKVCQVVLDRDILTGATSKARMSAVQPLDIGQRVRISGNEGDRYIDSVFGACFIEQGSEAGSETVSGSIAKANAARDQAKLYTDQRSTIAELPGVVAAVDPRTCPGAGQMDTANEARAARVIVPITGVLTDIAVYFTDSFGNIDVFVTDDSPTTRARLWSTGSLVCPAANSWQIVGNPGISVVAGEQLEFGMACSSVSAKWAAMFSGAWARLPVSFAPSLPAPILGWSLPAALPFPTTVTEASMVDTQYLPLVLGRIV